MLRIMNYLRFIVVTVFVVFVLAACGRAERNPEGGIDIPVNLTEQQVADVIARILAEGGNPLLRDPQVDFQPGLIVITGEHERRDGGGTVSGSLNANVGVSNGSLTIMLTNVQIEGYTADQSQIDNYNRRIAEALTGVANQLPNVQVVSASVTNTELQLVINATRR
jgi:hypothetical protein